MVAVALLTLALAGAPRLAVVDLSVPPSSSLAEALRNLPELKGRVLSASQTKLVVADAAGLGLRCAHDDDDCLQKLVVLARVDELIALDATAHEVKLARVSARAVRRAATRVAGGAAARAHAAWGALERAASKAPARERAGDDAHVITVAPPREAEEGVADDVVDAPPSRRRTAPAPTEHHETPTASSGGVTAPLVVGMSGAGAALVLGAGTVGVSAALAQQLRGTQRGIPLDDSYDTLQLAFWSLSALTAASLITGAVGLGLFLVDDGEAVTEP